MGQNRCSRNMLTLTHKSYLNESASPANCKQVAACCEQTCRAIFSKEPNYTPTCVCSRTWIKGTADHSWEDDEDERQHLQIGSKDRGSFDVTHVLGRQGPLHNHLHAHI